MGVGASKANAILAGPSQEGGCRTDSSQLASSCLQSNGNCTTSSVLWAKWGA